jgi:predicted phage tail protein
VLGVGLKNDILVVGETTTSFHLGVWALPKLLSQKAKGFLAAIHGALFVHNFQFIRAKGFNAL